MKKYITIAALLTAGTALANAATLTEIATMSALASASEDTGTSVVETTENYTNVDAAYSFTGAGSILKISNTDLLSYVEGGDGYLTIAAWIKPTSTNENSIFSFGGQNDGFKFALKNGGLQVTTKGILDTNVSGSISTEDWTLVAVSINLSQSGNSRFYFGTEDNSYYTKQLGTWNDSSSDYFAIGSGNSTSVRDGFVGEIANLKLFSSNELVTNSDIVSKIGPAPVNVPEPSAFGLLAGVGALALVASRRRRR